jgi:TolB-like protein/DNA-binding winged helix-turn-helix (wHTH) protein
LALPGNPERSLLRFGVFEVDLGTGELHKAGSLINLSPQPFKILVLLASCPGQLVTREEIQRQVWGSDTFVDFEQGLNFAVKKIRAALSDDAETPRYIETLPRRGYRFIAPVEVVPASILAHASRIVDVSGPAESQGLLAQQERPVSAATGPVEIETAGHALPEKARKRLAPRLWRPALTASVLFSLLALVAGLSFSGLRDRVLGRTSPGSIQSLAVLPLENLSGDKEQEYFVDGMTDELITALAKIRSLRVISRTSAMRYKGAVKPLAAIARDLKVDAVVEGTVLRSGDRLRITAQLIRVVPEQHLWAESYERDLRDVLALQRDVARAIVHEIQIKLSVQEQARLARPQPAVNPEAHELYLKGLYFLNKRTEIGLRKGVEYFQKAVEKDSGYALAYAGLANSYDILGGYSVLPSAEAFPKAEAAATAALALDSELAEAHTSLGFARLMFDWNWAAAEKELKQGIELRPNDATAHEYYSTYFNTMGQAEEAIAEMRRARELDPLSLDINAQLGVAYRDGRHADQAVEQCRKTLELDPNFEMAHWCLGLAYVAKGMYEEAVQELRTAVATGGCPCKLAALGYTYAITGDRARAQGVLRDLKIKAEQGYELSYLIAEVYAGLRDYEQAFQWLNKAYNHRDSQLSWLKLDPLIDNLRSDPRLADLMHRVGLP